MDYYERKKKAILDIDEMLEKGVKRAIIVFIMAGRYGFSEKIIDKRIKETKDFIEEKKQLEAI